MYRFMSNVSLTPGMSNVSLTPGMSNVSLTPGETLSTGTSNSGFIGSSGGGSSSRERLTTTTNNQLLPNSNSLSWGFSFEMALSAELHRIFSETETCKKTSVETVKLRLIDRVLRLLEVSPADLMRILSPEMAFVHPQVSAKLLSLFDRPNSRLWRHGPAEKLLDRVSASDYNDCNEVRDLVEALEHVASICDDPETTAEIRATLAYDGLGDCSRHLRYPLTKETSVRARPIGSDYDAERVHVEAVRKMYEEYRDSSPAVVRMAILDFYDERGDLTGTPRSTSQTTPHSISPAGQLYSQCVGSFADLVWKEVVEPKFFANKIDSEQKTGVKDVYFTECPKRLCSKRVAEVMKENEL